MNKAVKELKKLAGDKVEKPIEQENPALEKALRKVLNKVSEGNIEPLFGELI